MKEFWTYLGSETVQPYRETVQWIIVRATVLISSNQVLYIEITIEKT